MGQFIVLHMEKRLEVSPILERHIIRMEVRYVNGQRQENVWVPDNADIDRSHLNRELVSRIVTDPDTGMVKNLTIQQAVNRRIKEAGIGKIRKNQNSCLEVIFSGSPDTLNALSHEKVNDWANDTLAWAQQQWGKDNVVSATLHCDEKTPHMHVILVPIVQGQSRRSASEERKDAEKGVTKKKYKTDTTKNRLSANEVYTKPLLYGYHTSYAETVGEKYGLSRGVKAELGSYKKHTTSIEYNRMLERSKAEQEQLLNDLMSDYADISAKFQAGEKHIALQKSKIDHNNSILKSQIKDYEQKKNDLEEVNENIDKRMDDLKSLTSYGLLNFIKKIPDILKSDLQEYIQKYWKGTIKSCKVETVDFDDTTCKLLKVNMLNNDKQYYIQIRLSDGMVWYNGEKNPYRKKKTGEILYMKELVSYYRQLTPDAKKLVIDLFKQSQSVTKPNKPSLKLK